MFITIQSPARGGIYAASHAGQPWVNAAWAGWLIDFQLIHLVLSLTYMYVKWIYLLRFISAAKSISKVRLPSLRNSPSCSAVAVVSPECFFYTLVINIATNSTASEVFKGLFVINLKILCKVYSKLFLDFSISCLCITYYFLMGFSSFWQAFHFLNAKLSSVIAS